MKGVQKQTQIKLERIKDMEIEIPLVGVTPLIPHKWEEKSLQQMRDKHMGGVRKAGRDPKNPVESAEATLYRLDAKRIGMPAVAFKAATVGACRFFDGVTMTLAKQCIYVLGEGIDQLVEIKGTKTLREDTPRNDNGNPDLRYRYAIFPWSAVITVRFPERLMTADSVIALVDAGGRGGIGDWRPSAPKSSTGTFGQYKVKV